MKSLFIFSIFATWVKSVAVRMLWIFTLQAAAFEVLVLKVDLLKIPLYGINTLKTEADRFMAL